VCGGKSVRRRAGGPGTPGTHLPFYGFSILLLLLLLAVITALFLFAAASFQEEIADLIGPQEPLVPPDPPMGTLNDLYYKLRLASDALFERPGSEVMISISESALNTLLYELIQHAGLSSSGAGLQGVAVGLGHDSVKISAALRLSGREGLGRRPVETRVTWVERWLAGRYVGITARACPRVNHQNYLSLRLESCQLGSVGVPINTLMTLLNSWGGLPAGWEVRADDGSILIPLGPYSMGEGFAWKLRVTQLSVTSGQLTIGLALWDAAADTDEER